jgi:5'-3' exoribonuclease 1
MRKLSIVIVSHLVSASDRLLPLLFKHERTGTPFMAKLSAQLKYFINKKITEDANWRGIQVVLSGHEVPGEGEHKIMEYIRLSKAQPDYNPNVRHCLYGLDADLIMLGLLSHDPHFCLLREEVKFGPVRKKGNTRLVHQIFIEGSAETAHY